MRRRRDPFARETYIPVRADAHARCSWCGTSGQTRRPIYDVKIERDGGRDDVMNGQYCSWSCAESYLDVKIGR